MKPAARDGLKGKSVSNLLVKLRKLAERVRNPARESNP